jgi:ribosome-binding protein aMBF1 (putative translation factor)
VIERELRLHHVLRDARRAAALSKRQLARRVGVSERLVTDWERARVLPDLFELRRFVEVTGADDLYDLRNLPLT